MVDVTVVKSESGELIKMGPIEIRVLEDGSNTDNRIGSVVLKIGPKTKGPILHWHRMHDETFLITKGKVRFHTDKGDHDTAAGDYVVVPPKSIHSFSNPFDEPAEFFNTFTPAYYVDYLRMISKAAQGKGLLTHEKQKEAMAQFATFEAGDEGIVEGEL